MLDDQLKSFQQQRFGSGKSLHTNLEDLLYNNKRRVMRFKRNNINNNNNNNNNNRNDFDNKDDSIINSYNDFLALLGSLPENEDNSLNNFDYNYMGTRINYPFVQMSSYSNDDDTNEMELPKWYYENEIPLLEIYNNNDLNTATPFDDNFDVIIQPYYMNPYAQQVLPYMLASANRYQHSQMKKRNYQNPLLSLYPELRRKRNQNRKNLNSFNYNKYDNYDDLNEKEKDQSEWGKVTQAKRDVYNNEMSEPNKISLINSLNDQMVSNDQIVSNDQMVPKDQLNYPDRNKRSTKIHLNAM